MTRVPSPRSFRGMLRLNVGSLYSVLLFFKSDRKAVFFSPIVVLRRRMDEKVLATRRIPLWGYKTLCSVLTPSLWAINRAGLHLHRCRCNTYTIKIFSNQSFKTFFSSQTTTRKHIFFEVKFAKYKTIKYFILKKNHYFMGCCLKVENFQ